MGELLPATAALAHRLISETVPVLVRSYVYRCWRCHVDGDVPAVLHHADHDDVYSVFDAAEGNLAALVGDLLAVAGHPSATTIHPRSSRATRSRYISHGCAHCDALFGAFHLHETFSHHAVEGRISRLPVVLTTQLTRLDWVLAESAHNSSDLR